MDQPHRSAVDAAGLRIVYGATVTGGALRFELGTTDMAAWVLS